MNALSLLGALAVGLSLGLTGAGGSILTLPVLVYLAGVPPNQAVGLSLLVVGTAALVGALQRTRAGEVQFRVAGLFAASGMLGAALGARLTHLLSPAALMLSFAALMTLVAVRMLVPPRPVAGPPPECHAPRCLAAGAGVGVLTGFLGVGGGFLLMPALLRFAGLSQRAATGTSLAVITCNCVAGLPGHLSVSTTPWLLALVFATIAGAGAFAGGMVADRLPEKTLRLCFAVLVLATAGYVFWKGWRSSSSAAAADVDPLPSQHPKHEVRS